MIRAKDHNPRGRQVIKKLMVLAAMLIMAAIPALARDRLDRVDNDNGVNQAV
jgi:hypothetical protein